ncbi:MAG: type II/IV secretion system ATPase subunit [Promethearchaeota archaeon]|jgi:flagellar protein FlaI
MEQIPEDIEETAHVEEVSRRDALTFREFYPVNPPFGFVGIEIDDETGKLRYVTVEPTLTEEEAKILNELKDILIERMDISLSVLKDEEQMEEYLRGQIKQAFKKLEEQVAGESEEKFIYYMKRDFLGYGKIDILMHDTQIEDISCNGVDTPIFIWHRIYESIPTNLSYDSKEELDSIMTRLAHKAGYQISVAHPILEGALPEGYRVHLTLDEVSKRGDTFTIRKFRANPYTIVDLINFGSLSAQMAAYLWVVVENLGSIMVCGATASGKTTLLNSISMFIQPEMKVITIEEVRELRLHENWIPMVTRPSFQQGVEEISLFDLLKSALRQRPNYIVVGEVRGEEAYTLFQSIAVGHGGLCTIHSDSVEAAVKRLISKPMNIPKMMLPLMNVLVQIRRVKLMDKVDRRVVALEEITGLDEIDENVVLQNRFEWNKADDSFTYNPPYDEQNSVFGQISKVRHVPVKELEEEKSRREMILKWMAEKGINSYEDVAEIVRNYYLNSDDVYNRARMGSTK